MTSITPPTLFESFLTTAERFERDLRTRFFHTLPELRMYVSNREDHRVLAAHITNKETGEDRLVIDEPHLIFEDLGFIIVPHTGRNMSPQMSRETRCSRAQADLLFDWFADKLKPHFDLIQRDWEDLKPLERYYVDRRSTIGGLDKHRPYILGCGYDPVGPIRETLESSSTDSRTSYEGHERVSEAGIFYDTTEHVTTDSYETSKTNHSYTYWQEYMLRE